MKNRFAHLSLSACLALWLGTTVSTALAASGPPVITNQPASRIILLGSPVAFSVGADGTTPFAYQWRRAGVSITNATNSSYTLSAVTTNDNGAAFSVVVTNVSGSVTSATAVLTVDPGVIVSQTNLLIAISTQSWKYDQSGANLGTAWKETNFNDSAWSNGLALLGYETTPAVYPESFRTALNAPDHGGPITTYYRTHFSLPSNLVSITLTSSNLIDDGVVYWLNGGYAGNLRVSTIPPGYLTQASSQPNEGAYELLTLPTTNLLAGDNLLAAEVHQSGTTSSDVVFGLSLQAVLSYRVGDTNPPVTQLIMPTPGSSLEELTFISVTFDKAVAGVNATDLLINGSPATNLLVVSDREYQFDFPQPSTGAVVVTWATPHGITDKTVFSNAFAGGSWSYTLDPGSFHPPVVISEFMADNANGIEDEDGTHADWIELYNPGPLDANLGGWFLTDSAANPAKWQFPVLTLGANSYLLVWASSKNRTNPVAPLHTNFKMGKSGGYLGLYDSHTNVVSAFSPTYPAQTSDISYGRDRVDSSLLGFFSTPTPGAQNSTTGAGFAPAPVFSVDSGVFTNDSLTVSITTAGGSIRYTLNGSLPTTNSLLYTGPLTLATNATIRARVYQTNLWPSPIVARNYVFLDSTTRDFNSNLPLLIMNTTGRAIAQNVLPGQTRTAGSFVLVDTTAGRSWLRGQPQAQGLAEFEIFGQTSAGFPKKPYNIEIQDELGNDQAVSLLGMPAEADWKLRNPYSDKCMMNDFLAYELFEKMGHYSCRRRFVEVFVATTAGRLSYPRDYSGILVLLEKIERGNDRVDIAELTPGMTNEPNISGGYMFKKDKNSDGDLNFNTSGGGGFSGQALKIHEPKPREITTNQVNWIRSYLNRMEQALYASTWLTATGTNHYSYYLDADSFADMHWIVEFPKQIDGYRLSDYMQKDRNGKVKLEPIWDWNLSFGNANYADGGHVSGWYYSQIGENDHIWLRRLITGTTSTTSTSGDPDFNQKIADRWGVLRTNVLNGTILSARIDELAAALSEAADRDFAKFPRLGTYIWPNPNGAAGGWDVDYQNPTTYAGIISEMKNWVLGRYLWIDSQFTQPPTLNHSGGQITPGFTLVINGPAGVPVYYTLNGTDPRLPGGGIAPGASNGTGTISIPINANTRVVARAKGSGTWNSTWSGPAAATLYTALPTLRITELMYNPPSPPVGNTNNNDDFEFIELTNTGTNTLNLVGFRFTNGIDFTFTATNWITSLAAGQRVVLVKNFAAFASRYPSATNRVAGEYSGSLNNAGESLALIGPMQEPVLDFAFSDAWYPVTDGGGFSLVVVNESAAPSAWTNAAQWRASAFEYGSPGLSDPATFSIPHVLVNELLSHPDSALGQIEVVELFNPTATNADLSGWYLTDNAAVPKKYRFPNGTILPPGCYLVVTEPEFNPGGLGFSFSDSGEEVWLFSGDTNNLLTGYAQGFGFGAAEAGVSFGRYVNSQGSEDFVAQSVLTLGTNNAAPLVGPVVINEIMYHPQALTTNDPPASFIELLNITTTNVPLYHTAAPTNTWHLRNAADFDFPTNVTLPPGGTLLVVGFDPATNTAALASFRSRYGVATNVPIYGPWQGSLPNSDGALELKKPDPTVSLNPPHVMVDKVHYYDTAPWPAQADGLGAALVRLHSNLYANDPTNWTAAYPSPGTNNPVGQPPVITTQPLSQSVPGGSNATFTAAATSDSPLFLQWQFNGTNLPCATNITLVRTNVQLAHAGPYRLLAMNASGSALSDAANLVVLVPLAISSQPISQSVFPHTNITFTVSVSGSTPISYQWRFHGTNLPGATNASLARSDVLPAHAGDYAVLVTNSISSVLSATATLTVWTNPIILVQPVGQAAGVGSNAAFSVTAISSTLLRYQWYFNASTLLSGATNSTYSISNVQSSHYGSYSVVVSDSFGSVLSDSAYLADRLKPSITEQPRPTNPAMLLGNDLSISLTAIGPQPVTFNLMKGGNTEFSQIPWDSTCTFSLTNLQFTNSGTYYVVVTNIAGSAPNSSKVYLTMLEPLTNHTARAGSNVTFSFQAASAAPNLPNSTNNWLKYQWWFNQTNLLLTVTNLNATFTNVTLNLTNVQLANEGDYQVVITNANGLAATQTATLMILRPPTITQQPTPLTVSAGAPAYFAVSIDGSGPLTCQWQRNGNPVAGGTAPALFIPAAQSADAGSYRIIVTNSEGSATSEVASLTVLLPPEILQQPTNQTVHPGTNIAFTVLATGDGMLTYQWWFNSTNLLPSATNATVTLTNVQGLHAGAYHVIVSNSGGAIPSQAATLTVLLPPTLSQPPTSRVAECSSTAVFTVVAEGTAPFFYQWFFGANIIAGANESTLTLTNAGPARAGSYSVVVTNSYGSVTSAPVTLTVVDTQPPAILSCPPFQNYTADASCQFALPDLTGTVTALDACSSVTVTQRPPAGTLIPAGVTYVTLTVKDAAGNSSDCLTTVTVQDHAAPVILFTFTNLTLAAGANCQALMPDLTGTNYFLAVDNCSSVTVTQSVATNTPLALGTNPVVLAAFDTVGNVAYSTNVVVVADQTPPVPTCSTNILLSANAGLCSRSNVTFTVTATDNCSVPVVVCLPPSGSTFPLGTNLVTCTATDSRGNATQCVFTVTVADTENPRIFCPASVILTKDAGQAGRSNVTFTARRTTTAPWPASRVCPPAAPPSRWAPTW